MIYRNNYLGKEIRQAYREYRISINWLFTYGVFLGMISFAVHFLLQTLYESVLTQAVPEFMLQSYFSVTFTYTNIAYIFFLMYFLYYFKYLTFSEIRDNSWYLLVKMGYSPIMMIITKLSVRLISSLITYTVGYLISLLLTVFLKYPFVTSYLFPVYISGLLDVLLIVLMVMAISLLFKLYDNARIVILFSAVLIYLIKIQTGYYKIVSDRTAMQSLDNIFSMKGSMYLIIAGIIVAASFLICVFMAQNIAKYYCVKEGHREDWAVQDYKTGRLAIAQKGADNKSRKYLAVFRNVVLFIIILIVVIFNVFVLVFSAMTPGKEVNFNGTIPYVFQSTTMQPDINMNDLVFFKKIDSSYPLQVNEIVLYEENKQVYIERVKAINGKTCNIDIDYYPPMSEKGALNKNISTDSIYGLYSGSNRWLGALILFANTIFGRLLLMVFPAVMIFFYRPIVNYFRKLTGSARRKK